MDQSRLITYSILAYINNHEGLHIHDLNDFFLPLIKRTISKMNEEGITRGVIDDIKQRVDRTYSLDIPYPILKKMVKRIALAFNSDEEKLFETYHDGSFVIKKYVFAEYEDIVKAQEADVEALADAYKRYLIANQLDPLKEASIFEFLDANRSSLSRFFANKSIVQSELQFDVQARFVNSVRVIPQLYNILRKVYLGSIITSAGSNKFSCVLHYDGFDSVGSH